MKPNVKELLENQIVKEFESGYLYLNFSKYFTERGLAGFANWFLVQAMEESDHAMKIFKYLQDERKEFTLGDIIMPRFNITSDMDVLMQSLKHECYVTSLINNIYEEAEAAGDKRTLNFLDWFIEEQAEEERNAYDLIKKYDNFGEGSCLYFLDSELGERKYEPIK